MYCQCLSLYRIIKVFSIWYLKMRVPVCTTLLETRITSIFWLYTYVAYIYITYYFISTMSIRIYIQKWNVVYDFSTFAIIMLNGLLDLRYPCWILTYNFVFSVIKIFVLLKSLSLNIAIRTVIHEFFSYFSINHRGGGVGARRGGGGWLGIFFIFKSLKRVYLQVAVYLLRELLSIWLSFCFQFDFCIQKKKRRQMYLSCEA